MPFWISEAIDAYHQSSTRPTLRSPVQFSERGFMAGVTRDKLAAKAVTKFWSLAAKLPEDAKIGTLVGRRYEVRVTDVGGRGLAQHDQKRKVIKVTCSPAEAMRLAEEHDGSVWDRKTGYLVFEPGDADPTGKKQRREKRDAGTWGWFGGDAGEEEPDR